MRVLHDLRCVACERFEVDVIVDPFAIEPCVCGGERRWVPTKMTTDLFATPQASDATGQVHSSQREKERAMARKGYYPAGDKVGGARPELRILGTKFSYKGQASRA